MSDPTGTLELRGEGGLFRYSVQSTQTFAAVDDWLYAVLTGAFGAYVYEGWVTETESIPEGTLWYTYRWVRNAAPITYTFGQGADRVYVAAPVYEVLVWQQGKSFADLHAPAAQLRSLLDIGPTATTGGTIRGGEMIEDARGYYSRE